MSSDKKAGYAQFERKKCATGTITCIKEDRLSLQKKDIISNQYNDDGDNYRE